MNGGGSAPLKCSPAGEPQIILIGCCKSRNSSGGTSNLHGREGGKEGVVRNLKCMGWEGTAQRLLKSDLARPGTGVNGCPARGPLVRRQGDLGWCFPQPTACAQQTGFQSRPWLVTSVSSCEWYDSYYSLPLHREAGDPWESWEDGLCSGGWTLGIKR